MIKIVEVNNKREQKKFVDFPYSLYKGNPGYTPPLYGDEKLIFSVKKNVYSDTCDSVCFNAYDGEKLVGRIQGIIQKALNKDGRKPRKIHEIRRDKQQRSSRRAF